MATNKVGINPGAETPAAGTTSDADAVMLERGEQLDEASEDGLAYSEGPNWMARSEPDFSQGAKLFGDVPKISLPDRARNRPRTDRQVDRTKLDHQRERYHQIEREKNKAWENYKKSVGTSEERDAKHKLLDVFDDMDRFRIELVNDRAWHENYTQLPEFQTLLKEVNGEFKVMKGMVGK